MLTLWDWKQEKIVLRSKAFSQDIFCITFSTELIGQLTTSGVGHIRLFYTQYMQWCIAKHGGGYMQKGVAYMYMVYPAYL